MSERYIKLENLVGKEIVSTDASKLGVLEEFAFDLELKNFAMVVAKDNQTKVYVPSQSIEKVKDVILVKAE